MKEPRSQTSLLPSCLPSIGRGRGESTWIWIVDWSCCTFVFESLFLFFYFFIHFSVLVFVFVSYIVQWSSWLHAGKSAPRAAEALAAMIQSAAIGANELFVFLFVCLLCVGPFLSTTVSLSPGLEFVHFSSPKLSFFSFFFFSRLFRHTI